MKKISRAKKVGHTGTLDPFATGVMICCINNATRLARFFLHGDKKYRGVLCLGVETDSFDATGTITSTSDVDFKNRERFSDKKICSVFKQFQGPIQQIPPVFSALKHKGVPLYKLAREGNPVQKQPRPVNIFDIDVLEIDLPFVHFEVACSAGTYIRTLSADIGKILGCGGHLKELRRIETCGFTIDEASTLPDLEKYAFSGELSNTLIGMSKALRGMPEYIAEDTLVEKVKNGKPISLNDNLSVPVAKMDGSLHRYLKIVDKNKDLCAVLSFDIKENRFNYCCVFNN